MNEISTTKMSSKGQVVIPEEIRNKLSLQPGAKFAVVANLDTVVLKVIQPPSMEDIKTLLYQAKLDAQKAGAKRSDIDKAIHQDRTNK